jgi:SAM-dependent methyltransferase
MGSEEQKIISSILSDQKLYKFIASNLKQGLPSIGFSADLVKELTENLHRLDVEEFIEKHSQELDEVFTIGFFQNIVPAYFEKYVIPEIPQSDKFLDIGCGTGILISRLADIGNFKKLTGIDILSYPEWSQFSKNNIDFKIVENNNFLAFLSEYKPDSITLTWTLHHMQAEEQIEYLRRIFSNMKAGSKLVILEDAYSKIMNPENGMDKYEKFMGWDEESRKKIMSVYDWVANRVLAQRAEVPIPFGYRTMEEWISLGEQVGFKCFSRRFIGFPDKRDISTPQSLIVLDK